MKGDYSVPCIMFTEDLLKQSEDEARIIPLFEKNLTEGTLQVFYQPKISVARKALVGAEALSRLVDDDGTFLLPGAFIPVLEKTGKIVELDFYVLRKVLEQMQLWRGQGYTLFPISVNLSQLHFYHVNLVEDILSIVREYNIEPEYIEFEVTETVFISETALITEKLNRLRQYGFKVSVDDFGAGYSSLNLIGILPVDIIKLDKGFVSTSLKTVKGKEIVKGLIDILNRLQMNVICEGIEDKESEKIINSFGCDEVQGFLYDKPLPQAIFQRKYVATP